MKQLRVSLCQFAAGFDKAANIAKACSFIEKAAMTGAELVVLPECFNAPYGVKYFSEYAEAVAPGNATYDAITNAARSNRVTVVAGTIPERADGGEIYNTSMSFGPDGALLGVYRKIHLFRINTDTVKMDEGLAMQPGSEAVPICLPSGIKFGVVICFDIRYPMLAWKYANEGTSFLVCPGAFNMVTGPKHWELCARARAVDNQQYVLMCSASRVEDGEYVAWGHSMVTNPLGEVIASLDEKEGILSALLDFELTERTREQIPILKGVRHDLYTLQWHAK